MAITAKPITYTVNTGSSYQPEHLYMLMEGTGTASEDDSKTTDADLTLQNTAMWGTDGTHGAIITCSSGSSYYARSAAFPATMTSGLAIAIAKGSGTNPIVAESIVGFGRAAGGGYIQARILADSSGEMDCYANDGTDQAISDGTPAGDVYDTTWRMYAVKFKEGEVAGSVDGAAWAVGTNALANVASIFDIFAIGVRGGSGTTAISNMAYTAAWAYIDDYTTWSDSWISALYNSGDPWSMFLQTSALLNQQPQFYRRPQPLLRM